MDTKEINSIILGCYKGVEFGWWYVNNLTCYENGGNWLDNRVQI